MSARSEKILVLSGAKCTRSAQLRVQACSQGSNGSEWRMSGANRTHCAVQERQRIRSTKRKSRASMYVCVGRPPIFFFVFFFQFFFFRPP